MYDRANQKRSFQKTFLLRNQIPSDGKNGSKCSLWLTNFRIVTDSDISYQKNIKNGRFFGKVSTEKWLINWKSAFSFPILSWFGNEKDDKNGKNSRWRYSPIRMGFHFSVMDVYETRPIFCILTEIGKNHSWFWQKTFINEHWINIFRNKK